MENEFWRKTGKFMSKGKDRDTNDNFHSIFQRRVEYEKNTSIVYL